MNVAVGMFQKEEMPSKFLGHAIRDIKIFQEIQDTQNIIPKQLLHSIPVVFAQIILEMKSVSPNTY